MEAESGAVKELSVWDKIIGIFTSPREALVSINQNPTWLIPFIIGLVFFFIFQYATVDYQMDYQIAKLEAKELPAEQFAAAQSQMQGPVKYLGFIFGPIVMLIIWAAYAGCFLLFGNWMIGGESNFKKMFSMVSWTSLVGIISLILMTFLITSKGTMHGVALDLSLLLPTPAIGAQPGLLYLFLSKIDFIVIWQVILWIIGLSVIYNTTTKKAAVPILTLWGLWIVISITFTSVFGNMF
jgi:hypothetical protein